MADGSTPCRVTRGIPNFVQNFDDAPSFDLCITQDEGDFTGLVARMVAESSIKMRHDPISMETMDEEGSKSIKRKEVVHPSNSKSPAPSTEKRRKVIDGSSVNKGKNVVEDGPSKELESNFFVKDAPTHPVHMSCCTNTEVFKQLKEKLTDKQYKMFGETCFGVFIRMQHCDVQA
ncbi:uncharacterized protein LOC132624887 [Lycium barbarum]|uniref:uncharacterized protein LOC132624887 n=1 Tax=Lycium barbarum TaxID=112863 RepID=UPI00293E4E39|nr:uncharacterized protein LOC132624887 [Lycium barbarum]